MDNFSPTKTRYFATFYPMDSKGKAGEALRTFCWEYVVPDKLRFDGSKEQTGKNTEFQQIRKNNIQQHVSEPDMHNQSPADGEVREIRKKWYRVMVQRNVPKVFWDYGMRALSLYTT
jgi:acid phosphatase class B